MAESLPSISVLILNYNGQEHLTACFDSLLELHYPPDRIEILLVDNASTDGSVDWVIDRYPMVRVVQNGANLGFAAGNTVGAQAAQGEWIAFLNPDTRVEPDWLLELVRPALRDPAVVCVASKMLAWDGCKIDYADAAINFMGWGCQPGFGSTRLSDFNQDKAVLFACGGAMLIKKQVFLEVGGFDTDFFAYYEDVDLGWRLWLMGYQVAYAGRAVVYHRHHGSWSTVNNVKRWVLAERNALYTTIKNYDEAHLTRVLPGTLLLTLYRAYLDLQLDPAVWGAKANMPAGPLAYGPRYYLGQLGQLARRRAWREFWQRSVDEAQRRVRRHSLESQLLRPSVQAKPDGFTMPAIAVSRLIAGQEVLNHFDLILARRRVVQAARQRADGQIFPLFKWALVSNFNDERFIRGMQVIIARFGLVSLFERVSTETPVDAATADRGYAASRALLNIMDRVLKLSGAPTADFQLGSAVPQEAYPASAESLNLLIETSQLIWQLPTVPLNELLCWLVTRCQGLLDSFHHG